MQHNFAAPSGSTWRPRSSPWEDGASPFLVVVLLLAMVGGLGAILALALFQ